MGDDKKKTVFSKKVLVSVVVVTVAAICTAKFWILNNRKPPAQSAVNEVHKNPQIVPSSVHEGDDVITFEDKNKIHRHLEQPKPQPTMTKNNNNMQNSSGNMLHNEFINDLASQTTTNHNQCEIRGNEDVKKPSDSVLNCISLSYDANMHELTEQEKMQQKAEIINVLEKNQLESWLAGLEPEKLLEKKSIMNLSFLEIFYKYSQFAIDLTAYLDSKDSYEKIKDESDEKEQALKRMSEKQKKWQEDLNDMFEKIFSDMNFRKMLFGIIKKTHNDCLKALNACVIKHVNSKNINKEEFDKAANELKIAIDHVISTYPPCRLAETQQEKYGSVRNKDLTEGERKIISQKHDEAKKIYEKIKNKAREHIESEKNNFMKNMSEGTE